MIGIVCFFRRYSDCAAEHAYSEVGFYGGKTSGEKREVSSGSVPSDLILEFMDGGDLTDILESKKKKNQRPGLRSQEESRAPGHQTSQHTRPYERHDQTRSFQHCQVFEWLAVSCGDLPWNTGARCFEVDYYNKGRCSLELCDFVNSCLTINPKEWPTRSELMRDSFIFKNMSARSQDEAANPSSGCGKVSVKESQG